ncbi:MAG: restriction endonuclease subunit S [Prevotella sp.]|nr:restriction endonuclease subunit S [Prevotella sp.]
MNAQQLRNSILQDLIHPQDGWIQRELKDVVDPQCPISYGIVQQGEHIEDGVPVVRPVDLHNKYVRRIGLKCTTQEISNSYSRTILNGNEILICVRGTTGIIGLATEEIKGCNVNRGIVPLFFQSCYDKKFMYYQLLSPLVQEAITENTTGSALKQINIKELRSIKFYIPPLAEQKRIVAKIEELLPKVEEYGKAQDALDKLNKELPEKLKKSILQEAIAGRLVPQDPNDEPASVLLDKIRKEKEQLVKEGKLKKKDLIETPITEEEIPFEVPESWEWVRLGYLINLLSGRDLSPTEYNKSNNGIPYMTGASNFESGILIVNRWTNHPATISHKGDLLITCKGTIGEMAFNTIGDLHVARQIMAINSHSLNLNYVRFFLMRIVSELENKAKSIIPGISREDILNASFPLPPLAEQKRIVAKIEELFAEIDKLKM